MTKLTRRGLLQSALALPAAPAALAASTADDLDQPQSAATPASANSLRERLLLDFGWRFHFGHAEDPARDFNFRGNFSKTGNFGPVSTLLFDDNDWKAIDLPHDWAVELPFQNDPALASKGFYPL